MWRFGRYSLLPNYASRLRRLQARRLIRDIRESPSFPLFFLSPISHGALYNNAHSSFFFCPDLDLCGLPAWLLPWQHLEPSSSCWPCVFTESGACSSLRRGFASPSKVSSYIWSKLLCLRVFFFFFIITAYLFGSCPVKFLADSQTCSHQRFCFRFMNM